MNIIFVNKDMAKITCAVRRTSGVISLRTLRNSSACGMPFREDRLLLGPGDGVKRGKDSFGDCRVVIIADGCGI